MGKVLLVTPHHSGQGGVSNYYRVVTPHLECSKFEIVTFEIGSVKKTFANLHPIIDQLRYALILKSKPDLVHINPSLGWKSFIRDALFVLLAKQNGAKVLVFFRGWDKKFASTVERYFQWFFRMTFAKADHFVVLANEFKVQLQEWGVRQPIQLSTTVVDEQLLQGFSVNRKLRRLENEEEVKILFLASLKKAKGVFEVVDAVKILVVRGVKVTLLIAGDSSRSDELKAYIKNLKLPTGSISLLGYVEGENKMHALNESSIYCLPSHSEGLPNSVLEAMAFAMPVITTSVGGLTDFFQDGKMGIVVQPNNAMQIADAIEKLITNRAALFKMAKYNHDFARKNLLGPNVASFLTQTYEKTVNG